jgi:hypothetical protein
LPTILDNPIAASDVMQQEVAERVDDFVAKDLRHCECSAVDHGAGPGRDNGWDVTDRTADLLKDLFASLCIWRRS